MAMVMGDVCRRVLYLRRRHRVTAHVLLHRVENVKDAFRHVPVDLSHVATFGFVFDDNYVVDRFLQIVWWRSRGAWNLAVSSLEHAHNQTRIQNAVVCKHGKMALAHNSVEADIGRETMSLQSDCDRVARTGDEVGKGLFVRILRI